MEANSGQRWSECFPHVIFVQGSDSELAFKQTESQINQQRDIQRQ